MTTISALPPPPDPNDSLTTFNSKAFAFWAAIPGFRTEVNAVAVEINLNAIAAAASAASATTKAAEALVSELASVANAQAAAASAGGSAWVSGTTYAVGDRRWSLANGYLYRRRTVGAGTTDPSADATNWALVPAAGLQLILVTGTTQAAAVGGRYVLKAAGATTLTAPPSPQAGDEFAVKWTNNRFDNAIDFGGAKVEGTAVTTLTLNNSPRGAAHWVWIDSTTGWGAIV